MKKTLLSLFAIALFSIGAIAQTGTVTLPWNAYGEPRPSIFYQGKDASKVTDYTPEIGDVITVTIAGTANQDISDFQVALIDDAPPAYWKELAGFQTLGSVTAGTPFSFEIDLNVKDTGDPKLVFDGKNETLANSGNEGFINVGDVQISAGMGAGTSITLTLETYTVSVFKPIEGATVLIDNGSGTKQGIFTKLEATPLVAVDDVVRVNLKGVSDVNFTELQVVVVDGSEDAATAWWTELSAFTDADITEIIAGEEFDITIDVTILEAPVGTSANNQNIVVMAKSASSVIQLSLTNFTATIIDPSTPPTNIEVVDNSIYAITVYSATGVVLQTVQSIEELGAGVYFIKIEYANGAVETKKIVK